jgi:hypothetical protein
MKKWWDSMTLLRVRRAWRWIVIYGGVLLLLDLGWDHSKEIPEINGLLVLFGAVAVGMFFAKVWQELKG